MINYTVGVEQSYLLPNILTRKEYDLTVKNKNQYIELDANIKDFEKDSHKIDIYFEYVSINKNKKSIKWEKIYDLLKIDLKYLVKWAVLKPKYNIRKYKNIQENQFNYVYNNFLDILKYQKKINKIYIVVSVDPQDNNYLYKQFIGEIKPLIKIKKPIYFYRKLSSLLFTIVNHFICDTTDINVTDNSYFKFNYKYPHFIIIEYHSNIQYIPVEYSRGLTFDIKKLKITKVKKITILNDVYYYSIHAK